MHISKFIKKLQEIEKEHPDLVVAIAVTDGVKVWEITENSGMLHKVIGTQIDRSFNPNPFTHLVF